MKKIVRCGLFLAIILSLLSNVFAVNAAATANFSEQRDAEIYEASEMQKKVIDDNLVVYYTLEETINETPQTKDTYKEYISKTVSGRFYLISNGDTVAEYSLSVTFWYDRQTAGVSGFQSWIGNFKTGWTGRYNDFSSSNSSQVYVSSTFWLYHNDEPDNCEFITIYCDKYGTITVD